MDRRINCNVDHFGDAITIHPTDEEAKTLESKGGATRRRRARVIEYGESGIVDVLFYKEGTGEGPLKEIGRFILCKIMKSKNRFNIRLSFDKVETAAAEREYKKEFSKWFKLIKQHLN